MKINKVYCMDNLELLRRLPNESIDFIYCDILYNTGRRFKDYDDRLGTPQQAMEWYKPRLIEMQRVLKNTGNILLQCDYKLVHYLKVEMDIVFGINNFVNEVYWKRGSGNVLGKSNLTVLCDNLLIYKKTKQSTFNPIYTPLSEDEMNKKFPYIEEETSRRFNHEKLEKSSNEYSSGEKRIIQGREVISNIGWIWTQDTFDERLKENPYLIYWTQNGKPRYKNYADQYKGKKINNLWDDIQAITSNSKERIGYDTQKPKALLERIIELLSNEGDIVADFFCGSGTTLVVAKELGRKYIGCDINPKAVEITNKRLEG